MAIYLQNFFYSSSKIDEGFQTLSIFYFDVNGNFTNVDNNDQWNICTFQALAIAKRNIREKPEGKWFLQKSTFKDEKCWEVSYYYKNNYKTLFIDKDTGKILN